MVIPTQEPVEQRRSYFRLMCIHAYGNQPNDGDAVFRFYILYDIDEQKPPQKSYVNVKKNVLSMVDMVSYKLGRKTPHKLVLGARLC